VTLAGFGLFVAAGFVLMALSASAVPQEDTTLDLSDEKLWVVAEAYLEVFEIQQAYKSKIQTSATTEEAQMLQQEANLESHRVVEAKDDLTVQEYRDTLTAASEDDDLWHELVDIVEVLREERAQEER
jgi:uncharacterized protein YlzI (FlbEa/FlbD family)